MYKDQTIFEFISEAEWFELGPNILMGLPAGHTKTKLGSEPFLQIETNPRSKINHI
jgi:hypothetical protein